MGAYKNLKKALENHQDVTSLRLNITKDQLPYELTAFENLVDLNLISKSSFEWPEWFTELKKLKSLNIVAPKMESTSSVLFRLESLEVFKIKAKDLKQIEIPPAPNKSLKHLFINDGNLTSLPDSFCELTSLEVLSLSGNKLESLPKNFFELAQLKRLMLDRNKLKDINQLLGLKNIQHLSLDNNPLSEEAKSLAMSEFNIWFN